MEISSKLQTSSRSYLLGLQSEQHLLEKWFLVKNCIFVQSIKAEAQTGARSSQN